MKFSLTFAFDLYLLQYGNKIMVNCSHVQNPVLIVNESCEDRLYDCAHYYSLAYAL